MSNPREVLIVIDAGKLPQAWTDVMDVSKPVPLGVKFFERKIVTSDFLWLIFGTAVCLPLGLICLPLGLYMVWDNRSTNYHGGSSSDWYVAFFGLTLIFVAWACAASLVTNWKAMRRQDHGQPTRMGIFLGTDELLESRGDSFTLIPREKYVGIVDHKVKYTMQNVQTKKDETKLTRLPGALVRDDPRAMVAAIEAWAKNA